MKQAAMSDRSEADPKTTPKEAALVVGVLVDDAEVEEEAAEAEPEAAADEADEAAPVFLEEEPDEVTAAADPLEAPLVAEDLSAVFLGATAPVLVVCAATLVLLTLPADTMEVGALVLVTEPVTVPEPVALTVLLPLTSLMSCQLPLWPSYRYPSAGL